MSNSNFETRPLDEWFRTTVAGDIALCDAFSGEPLCGPHIANEPKNPSRVFVENFRLGNGYGYWKGSKYFDVPPLIGVYLTDPTRPDGLGDYAEFCDLASNFDVVAHSGMQSARMEQVRRLSGGLGKLVVANGVQFNGQYLAGLQESHSLVVNLSPAVDTAGRPTTPDGRALQAVRDAVITQGLDQKDPNDPDLTYLATDYVHANTIQWHDVLSAGAVGDSYYSKYGRPMTSMLVVAPYEHGDLGRKFVVSGVPPEFEVDGQTYPAVDVRFARPEYIDDPNTGSYALALDHGYIPHEALRDAQY